jgi:hypothetical protein
MKTVIYTALLTTLVICGCAVIYGTFVWWLFNH